MLIAEVNAIYRPNSELPTFILIVTILIQQPGMSFANLLLETDLDYAFRY